MRLATWNVAYGVGKRTNERRLQMMDKVNADVWVLTEAHDSLSLAEAGYRPVHGEQRPLGDGANRDVKADSRWVSIWSRMPIEPVDLPTGDSRRTAATITTANGINCAVYGTVLPWANDTATRGMAAELAKQTLEWERLRQDHDGLCVAGDFNVNLGGPHYYGSEANKTAVANALQDADLVAATRFDKTPGRDHGLIDHIAIPADLDTTTSICRLWGKRNDANEFLSDHDGVALDIDTW